MNVDPRLLDPQEIKKTITTELTNAGNRHLVLTGKSFRHVRSLAEQVSIDRILLTFQAYEKGIKREKLWKDVLARPSTRPLEFIEFVFARPSHHPSIPSLWSDYRSHLVIDETGWWQLNPNPTNPVLSKLKYPSNPPSPLQRVPDTLIETTPIKVRGRRTSLYKPYQFIGLAPRIQREQYYEIVFRWAIEQDAGAIHRTLNITESPQELPIKEKVETYFPKLQRVLEDHGAHREEISASAWYVLSTEGKYLACLNPEKLPTLWSKTLEALLKRRVYRDSIPAADRAQLNTKMMAIRRAAKEISPENIEELDRTLKDLSFILTKTK